jgi:chemotaxis protein CheD
MDEEIKVGMGDISVAKAPVTLAIVGLGSCVGVALYCPKAKIGGLAHVMLPDSSRSRPGGAMEKFADVGIPVMIERMKKLGGDPLFTSARLVGGASMFKAGNGAGAFNIGESNVDACRRSLKLARIRVAGEDVLGGRGRTMRFSLETGKIVIKYVDGTLKEL